MTVELTLDDAHRLLREGKVDGAIDAYAALLKERPDDWTTANRLGDLYVQTGQTDKAVDQFSHVAHCLVERNLLPKAAALYKKVLKVAPGDESTRGQLVDLALRQGFRVEAIGHLSALAEQRRAAGDDAGALEVQARIDSLRRPAAETDPTSLQQHAPAVTRVAMPTLTAKTEPQAPADGTSATVLRDPVAAAETRLEPTAADPKQQLKLQLIEDEVREGRLKRARQIALVVLAEAGDTTGHVLELAKRLATESGDATAMCADAMLEAARQGHAPATNIAAVRSLATWVRTQPESGHWPEGFLERIARIDAAAELELPSAEGHQLIEVGPDLVPETQTDTSRTPSPTSPFTTAVAAGV